MKKVACRINNNLNEIKEDFEAVLKLLEQNGYEIIWEMYPYTAEAVIEVDDQNGGVEDDNN